MGAWLVVGLTAACSLDTTGAGDAGNTGLGSSTGGAGSASLTGSAGGTSSSASTTTAAATSNSGQTSGTPPDLPPASTTGTPTTGTTGPPPPSCDVPAMTWETDFTTDPTLPDANGDGQPDWQMVGGTPFPAGELMGGAWIALPGSGTLRTNPPTELATRTKVFVNMQAMSSGDPGALLRVDTTPTAGRTTSVIATLEVPPTDQSHQRLRILALDDSMSRVDLFAPVDLGAETAHIVLDIDVPNESVEAWVGTNHLGQSALPSYADAGPGEHFVSLTASMAVVRFEHVEVQQCP